METEIAAILFGGGFARPYQVDPKKSHRIEILFARIFEAAFAFKQVDSRIKQTEYRHRHLASAVKQEIEPSKQHSGH